MIDPSQPGPLMNAALHKGDAGDLAQARELYSRWGEYSEWTTGDLFGSLCRHGCSLVEAESSLANAFRYLMVLTEDL